MRFKSIVVCYQAGILQPPPTQQEYRFTSNKVIFRKRFEAFNVFSQPVSLTYDDFVQGSDYSDIKLESLISSATDSFKCARSKLDQIIAVFNNDPTSDVYATALHTPIQRQEALCLVKVCIGNILFLHQLLTNQKILRHDGSMTIHFDFAVHKQLCVLKLLKAES